MMIGQLEGGKVKYAFPIGCALGKHEHCLAAVATSDNLKDQVIIEESGSVVVRGVLAEPKPLHREETASLLFQVAHLAACTRRAWCW